MVYHVFIFFTDREGKERISVAFNRSAENVRESVASPYMKNQAFLFVGRIVSPSKISRIRVFKSKKVYQSLVLPNEKSPVDEKDYGYITKCFGLRKVEDVSDATDFFITSPPQEIKEPAKMTTKPLGKKEKVFIVHGRDDKQALRLQKYLTRKLKIEAEMFEDFRERTSSNTIIEQLEYIRDNVGYAFVIVTPDDLGCLREEIDKCRTTMMVGKRTITVKSVCEILDNLHTRARQNVVFEHGLFIGALGRDKVCCLLQKDTREKPSDIDGILYVDFNKSVRETFPEITEKLKKIGLVKA